MARVICAGHVNWDVTLRVDHLPAADGEASITEQQQSGGGSASNVACALAALDVPTALLGSVGTDENGHLARRALSEAGVDCAPLVTVEGETAVKYLVVDTDGELMVLGNDGANESFDATDLSDDALAAADHLHLTSQDPETAASLAARASEAGLSVSFDPGRRIHARNYAETLSLADLVFLNKREATTAIEEHFGPIEDLARVIAIKHGGDGAEVLTPDGEYANHDGFPVDAVDTTGAGDAFAGGFIASMLDDETPTRPDYERALAVANACGALAASECGARTDLSWERVESTLADR
ncbi:carbohydrate kinase family protein [Halorientalis brevis]|uniref:Carbohydrate kinase family protein n=1 Tax=Halorientalis brevis TaxID=1126241 RepID=A0ABD6CG64_9EURY